MVAIWRAPRFNTCLLERSGFVGTAVARICNGAICYRAVERVIPFIYGEAERRALALMDSRAGDPSRL